MAQAAAVRLSSGALCSAHPSGPIWAARPAGHGIAVILGFPSTFLLCWVPCALDPMPAYSSLYSFILSGGGTSNPSVSVPCTQGPFLLLLPIPPTAQEPSEPPGICLKSGHDQRPKLHFPHTQRSWRGWRGRRQPCPVGLVGVALPTSP